MRQLKVVYRSTTSLIPYIGNARVHSEHQLDQIVASIREFGFVNPVLVDGKGVIIAGHGRVEAARRIGMDKVPVIELGDLSERQRKALTIADNKIALNATWNMDVLSQELSDIAEMELDLSLTGFDEQELDTILKAEFVLPSFEQTAPPAPVAPVPQPVVIPADASKEMNDPNPAVDKATPPEEFGKYDENIRTDFRCPSCSYEWSGKPK